MCLCVSVCDYLCLYMSECDFVCLYVSVRMFVSLYVDMCRCTYRYLCVDDYKCRCM